MRNSSEPEANRVSNEAGSGSRSRIAVNSFAAAGSGAAGAAETVRFSESWVPPGMQISAQASQDASAVSAAVSPMAMSFAVVIGTSRSAVPA
jgi:hypothetical protein